MILSCSSICKSFGSDDILKNASFHIEEHEKAAIVGINGAGKSTLLKIITGELPADSGEVVISKGKTLGYLAQNQDLLSHRTIYDEMLEVKRPVIEMEERLRELEVSMKLADGEELEAMMDTYSRLSHQFDLINGYAWKSEIVGVLKGLGFPEEEFGKQISTLSGGQKTRVSLGKLLLTSPDIILLDEPTNHLDMSSIAWLENYLLNYKGSVIIVAHDRYFLDKIVTKVVELDNGKATVYLGNYSAYSEKRAQMRAIQMKAYLNQQQEIKHQEEVIEKLKSFNREKSIKRAESREKMLNKIEVLEKPTEINDAMDIRLEPNILSGNDVLTVRDLEKSFGAQHLFSHVDFDVKRGERVAIIGDNGTGKTTILKMINGLVTPDHGEITLGSRVHIGYYDQDHQVLHMDKTLFEEISDAYPGMNNTQIRNTLASFLFTGDDAFKRIGDLSGGERGRVSLAKLMLSEANFLILDEPTNHLDIKYQLQLMELVRSIRNLRRELNVPQGKRAPLCILASENERKCFEENKAWFTRLAYASELQFLEDETQAPKISSSAASPLGTAYLPLGELIDLEKERQRLDKEVQKVQSEIKRAEGKLANQGFVSKAPAAVVEEERRKLQENRALLERVLALKAKLL